MSNRIAVWRYNDGAGQRRPTGRQVRVAVIDSGLRPDGAPASSEAGIALCRDHVGEIVVSADTRDMVGHGTDCALQVLSVAPDACIVPVKVFHNSLETDPVLVERAILLATDLGVDVISMSLATTRRDVIGPWYRACERAAGCGVTLVAAADSSPEDSYPAVFDCVIGVRAAATQSPFDFQFDPSARYECAAWGWTPSVEKAFERPGVNSIATATMAGLVALVLDAFAPSDSSALRELLARCASGQGSAIA